MVLIGSAAGAVVGVVARGWMRLVSDDPAFSWNGTAFIVVAFTLTGAGHGLAAAVRRAGGRRRWTTTARTVAVLSTLPIFTGAGVVMLPTVIGASLARGRSDWPRAARVLAALIAMPVPMFLAVELLRRGWTLPRLLGGVLMAATYAVIVAWGRATVTPVADGWRMRRGLRVATVAALLLLLGMITMSVVGLATADL